MTRKTKKNEKRQEWLRLKINNKPDITKKRKKGYGMTRTHYIACENAKWFTYTMEKFGSFLQPHHICFLSLL